MNRSATFDSASYYLQDPYIAALQSHVVPECLSPEGELSWGRLICKWNEKREDGSILNHTYASCVDAVTGDIYVDDSPKLIFLKIFANLIARPVFTLAKTAYHLSLYPVFCEIATAISAEQDYRYAIKNVCKELVDVVATPLWGLALMVAGIGVLILAPFGTDKLYAGRKFLGEIEQLSNWGERKTSWTLSKCFQPYSVEIIQRFSYEKFPDTAYEGDAVDDGLANFARAHIRYKNKNFDFFSCDYFPEGKSYHS